MKEFYQSVHSACALLLSLLARGISTSFLLWLIEIIVLLYNYTFCQVRQGLSNELTESR